MKRISRFLLGGVLAAAGTVCGQLPELQIIPRDIKVAAPWIMSSKQTRDYAASAQAREQVLKLKGDCKLVPGEVVSFTYGWNLTATLKTDPTKLLQPSYLRNNTFTLTAGDGHTTAELRMPTGQVVVVNRPANANAPVHSLISLATLGSIVGMTKDSIKNRLTAPSKVEKTSDGKEQWSYRQEQTERGYTTETFTAYTSGIIGEDIVGLNTTGTYPVALTRTLVMWDFKLTFNEKGVVESLEQGAVGPTEWKRVTAPTTSP